MGINSNDFSPENQPEQQKPSGGFEGTNLGSGPATTGSRDFLSLVSQIGISRIDASVEPYLEKVMKLVKDNIPSVSLVRLTRMTNCFAVRYDGPDGTTNLFGIQFVQGNENQSQFLYPASRRIAPMQDELRDMLKDKRIRVCDARIIVAGYEPEMAKWEDMANTIVTTLRITSVDELRNAQIMDLTSNEFTTNWSISEARYAEQSLSAHGIRPRMDVGLTLSAKIRQDLGREFREFDTDYRLFGVIGGYVEIREKEEFVVNNQRRLLYQPIFNITVCNSVIPLEGVAMILLAALAPTIYGSHFWARQWIDLSDGQPNPGMLEEDEHQKGKPIILKDQDELLDFVKTYFAQPIITFQFQDGGTNIPGLMRLAAQNPTMKNHFAKRLTDFFGTPEENLGQFELSRIIETRYDGAYGDRQGTLLDSRNVDYLYIAAKNGVASIDGAMRRMLLGGSENPTDRARLVQTITNSFTPLYFDTVAVINPEFIKWIIAKTDARRLQIVDPNGQNESRSIGSFINGFGSATNMGSIITNGQTNRGLNLGSVWQI